MPRPKHTDRQVRAQLARRIQEARVERGWTREQLAEALGLQAVQMVWKYETGRLSISATMLYRLAGALGVPVELLLSGTGSSKSEAALVAAWRRLNAKEQEIVLHLALRLSEGPPKPSVHEEGTRERPARP